MHEERFKYCYLCLLLVNQTLSLVCSVCLGCLISDTVLGDPQAHSVKVEVKSEPDFDEEPDPGQKLQQLCSGKYGSGHQCENGLLKVVYISLAASFTAVHFY